MFGIFHCLVLVSILGIVLIAIYMTSMRIFSFTAFIRIRLGFQVKVELGRSGVVSFLIFNRQVSKEHTRSRHPSIGEV